MVIGEPTKFNHDRWGVVLGIRSGTVRTEWTSFSDALKRSSPYKGNSKKGKNNYQWVDLIRQNTLLVKKLIAWSIKGKLQHYKH